MNDAKSMLMMYSYAAMKAAEENTEEKDTTKVKAETKTKSDKDTKRRGNKNDEGRERENRTISEKRVPVLEQRGPHL